MQTARRKALAAMGFIATAAAVSTPSEADTIDEDKAALRAADETVARAHSKGDLETLVALYAEDAVLLPADEPELKGRDAIRKYIAAELAEWKPGDSSIIVESTQGVSGNVGWSSGRTKFTEADGKTYAGKFLSVSRKVNGKWLYIRDTWNDDGPTAVAAPSREDDQKALAKLDADYQQAVERNDTKTMARILADDFILVLGDGMVYTKDDLLKDAMSGNTKYQQQVDSDRTIRVWGNTAVVTAKLWAKGLEDGKLVDYYQWFSDTWVRTPTGWSYVFGQASLALPKGSK